MTDLARLSLEQPVFVSVHENATHTTPDTLTQSYIVTDLHHKVPILYTGIHIGWTGNKAVTPE